MISKKAKYLLLLAAVFLLPGILSAQQPIGKPSPKDTITRIEVDHADLFEYIQQKGQVIQKLDGHVELRQDSVFMYCDTATIIDNIDVTAKGNVIIQQGDSVSVFADSLIYAGATRQADLFGEVVLVNGQQQLFTNRLTYDLNTKVATFFEGATLTNDETQLTSKRGYYYVNEREAFFKDSVVVVDPDFTLRSDTLKFNTETKVVYFLGPTLISSDSSRIYCEGGFYDTENNLAEFTENAQYVKGEQKAVADIIKYDGQKKEYTLQGDALFEEGIRLAKADLIRYNEIDDKTYLSGAAEYRDSTRHIRAEEIYYDAKDETYSTRGRSRISDPPQILEADQVDYREEDGLGFALGNVIWQDTSARTTIVCEEARYNRKTGYLQAVGGRGDRPLLISMIDEDSLFMTSDTLLSVRVDSIDSDSNRLLLAYHDVRIFKNDLQAICDSLAYSTVDSLFRLFVEPVIWSDTTQFKADTVHIALKNNKVDRIFLYNNSFIINSPDFFYFNQIKGKDITAFFEENELRRMDVSGNAETVYYARDDAGGYIGVNKTICSDMLLYFGNNQVDKIKFFAEPKGTLHPMKQADHESLKMKGFHWETKLRPMNIEALFEHREPRAVASPPAVQTRPREGVESRPAPPDSEKR